MNSTDEAGPSKVTSAAEALRMVEDGMTILAAGFGDAGRPDHLLESLRVFDRRRLTIVSNNAGRGDYSLGGLISDGAVERIICSFPKGRGATSFREALDAGRVEMELTPQGLLTERLRAAAAGVVAFYLPAPVGTDFEKADDRTRIDGLEVQLYRPLHGDAAFVAGAVADRTGNVRCRLAARNFNPVMAGAGARTIVEVDRIVEPGEIAPDDVHIPGVLVDAVVLRPSE